MSKLYETLVEREYIYQTTNSEKVKELLNGKPICAYVGIDPTADCLHIGHCMPLILAKYLQDAGHKVVVVLGTATAMIGDPSGKSDMRKMVTENFIQGNKIGIEKIIGKFLKLDGNNPAIIVSNADWYKGYDYVDFIRDIGVHFNVNKMLACDCYKNRMENGGLTFFEMGYMLMQAYDFVHLHKEFNCVLEFGGSDQWANILAGADLGRKLALESGQDETYEAFTHVLLTNAEGKKMGKTEKGAIWVDETKCSPYEFYQYFYNCDDRDVKNLFKILTHLPLEEIETIMSGDILLAKKRMAFEVTKLVHGKELAEQAQKTSEEVFAGKTAENMPSVTVTQNLIGIALDELMVQTNFAQSKGEVRRLVLQNGLSVNGEKVTNFAMIIDNNVIKNNCVILQKGKKNFLKVNFEK